MANKTITFGADLLPNSTTSSYSLGNSTKKWQINGVADPKLTDTTYRAGTGLSLNNTTFNIDSNIVPIYGSALQTTNPFGGKSLYISKIDNAFYCANKRWTVTGTFTGATNGTYSASELEMLFNGTYENSLTVPAGSVAKIRITFDTNGESNSYGEAKVFPDYPYGYVYISYYYNFTPAIKSKMRAYSNYEPHGIGVHESTMDTFIGTYSATDASIGKAPLVEVVRQDHYAISYIEFEVSAPSNYPIRITQIEMNLDRPNSSRNPFLSKYGAEKLYYPLTAPQFIGSLNGNANTATKLTTSAGSSTQPIYFSDGKPVVTTYSLNKTVPSDAKFTDTTYSDATTSTHGLMSTADKTKLDKITVDSNGIISSSNLPSYVDDVLEYNGKSNFPTSGTTGKIYVDTATNLTYRWGGSSYVEISKSLALGETSSTAYYGDKGKTAYTHATSDTGKALTSGLYKITTSSNGHVTAGTAVTKADITGLGIPAQDTTYSAGTGISLSGTTFSNAGVRSIAQGSTNGTISVNTNGTTANVAVKGLGSAAYTDSSAYATSGHTHNYAGSSSAGGSATSALNSDKINGYGLVVSASAPPANGTYTNTIYIQYE